jgi:hypothetical protein
VCLNITRHATHPCSCPATHRAHKQQQQKQGNKRHKQLQQPTHSSGSDDEDSEEQLPSEDGDGFGGAAGAGQHQQQQQGKSDDDNDSEGSSDSDEDEQDEQQQQQAAKRAKVISNGTAQPCLMRLLARASLCVFGCSRCHVPAASTALLCVRVPQPQKSAALASYQQQQLEAAAADSDGDGDGAAAGRKKQKKEQQHLAMEVEQNISQVAGIMSSTGFDSLSLSEPTAKGVAEMGFSHMTEVQVNGCERHAAGAVRRLAAARYRGAGCCVVGTAALLILR